MPPSADEAVTQLLLGRCVAGVPEAWRELHRDFYPVVRRFARGMGVRHEDIPDLCQEVFVQVFTYLNKFKGDAAFKTWLYRICLSQVARFRRRQRVREALELVFRRDAPARAMLATESLNESLVRTTELAISQLKPHLREVFVMFEIEGLDGAEIAKVLDCPTGTVRRRLHQARQAIEAALGVGTSKEGSL